MVIWMRANYPGHAFYLALQNWEISIFHSGLFLSQNFDTAYRQENLTVKTETSSHTIKTIFGFYRDNTEGLYGDFELEFEQIQFSLISLNRQKIEKCVGGF